MINFDCSIFEYIYQYFDIIDRVIDFYIVAIGLYINFNDFYNDYFFNQYLCCLLTIEYIKHFMFLVNNTNEIIVLVNNFNFNIVDDYNSFINNSFNHYY